MSEIYDDQYGDNEPFDSGANVIFTQSENMPKNSLKSDKNMSEFILNAPLSMDAKFLILFLSSFPSDIPPKGVLRKQLNIGRSKMERILKELSDAGYLLMQRRKGETGRYISSLNLYSYLPEYK